MHCTYFLISDIVFELLLFFCLIRDFVAHATTEEIQLEKSKVEGVAVSALHFSGPLQ
jgi:hypothetical protein